MLSFSTALVDENIMNCLPGPLLHPGGGGNVLLLQLPLNPEDAGPVQIAAVNAPRYLRLLRINLRLTVCPPAIAQQTCILEGHVASLPAFEDAPDHIVADGLTLRLGEAAEQRDHKFSGFRERIDVFLFEVDRDAPAPQHTDGGQTVHRIPREAGEGFGQDQVNASPFAGGDHAVELRPLFHAGAGDASVSENSGKFPIGVLSDFLGVILLLRGVAGELLLAVGGDPAVSGHPQLPAGGASGWRFLLGGGDETYSLFSYSLYTIVRFYGIDPRVFFYHERELDDPARSEFHALVDTCTEEEALTLTPIVRAILEALRRKGSITLEDNT